jgi:hypothetical protein
VKTIEQYLRHADECEALARKAATSEERKTLHDMATAWRKLAETRKKAQELKRKSPSK